MRRTAMLGLAALAAASSANTAPASAQGFRLYPGALRSVEVAATAISPRGSSAARRLAATAAIATVIHGMRPMALITHSDADRAGNDPRVSRRSLRPGRRAGVPHRGRQRSGGPLHLFPARRERGPAGEHASGTMRHAGPFGRCNLATDCRFLNPGTEKPPFRSKPERTFSPRELRPHSLRRAPGCS